MEAVTLRVLCETLNISRRRVQCYEKAGLLKYTGRNKYGHLLYDREAACRAEKIKFLQRLGFKLREIRNLIDAPEEVLKKALEQRVRELEIEQTELEQLVRDARYFVDALGKSKKGESK